MTRKGYWILGVLLTVFLMGFINPVLAQTTSQFTDNGDGTVTDSKTGLMWTQKDSGAASGRCLSWDASDAYVGNLQTGGHADWRMPTIAELKTIFNPAYTVKGFPIEGRTTDVHYPPVFAAGGAYWLWSSEKVDACCARGLGFNSGHVHEGTRDFCGTSGVRGVRGATRDKP